jgi:hypothetical protein
MGFLVLRLGAGWRKRVRINKEACLVYLTLPEDALHSVFINFHFNPKSCPNGECNPHVGLTVINSTSELNNKTEWALFETYKSNFALPPHEYTERAVFSVMLTGLEENQLYSFKIIQDGWEDVEPQIYTYQNFNTK